MRFRPCIDLHDGKVKQIVGSSLKDGHNSDLLTNFESEHSAAYFAELYKKDALAGGHVIKLGQGNDNAAKSAVNAYPKGLQVGGGITVDNAPYWLEQGADKVIVTSYIFENGDISWGKLAEIVNLIGKEKLVLDLSCRKRNDIFYVVIDRWQTFTSLKLNQKTFERLSQYCSEFLIHAVDVEGKQQGVDDELIKLLAKYCSIPVTYAGGVYTMEDVKKIEVAGRGKIDVTVGSALDVFGGTGVTYQEMVDFDRA